MQEGLSYFQGIKKAPQDAQRGDQAHVQKVWDMHEASCGSRDFPHNWKTCGKEYHTKQALVQHLKVHHPLASKEEHTCPECKVEFNLMKTMREHQATHKGSFPVEDCPTMFSLPKCHNCHPHEKHGFDARRY